MKKRIWIPSLVILVVLAVIIIAFNVGTKSEEDFISITSKEELNDVISYRDTSNNAFSNIRNMFINFLLTPMNIVTDTYYGEGGYSYRGGLMFDSVTNDMVMKDMVFEESMEMETMNNASQKLTATGSSNKKDFSTTNVQVEEVDEADTIKTDGDYIYSFNDYDVVITRAEDLKVVARIGETNLVPQDLILTDDKLIIISTETHTTEATSIYTYDITDRSNPKSISKVVVEGSYYTSRRIDNDVFVITDKYVSKAFEPIIYFNGETKTLPYNTIKYQRGNRQRNLTYITTFSLDKLEEQPEVNGYFINLKEAYVSQKNIYIMSQKYEYSSYEPQIKDLFGPFGIFGVFIKAYDYESTSGQVTEIKKFSINDGKIKYDCKAKIDGRTINQFSFDEYEDNLRIAVTDEDVNGVVILDKKLNKIGELTGLAKGEQIYSSRFIGTRLYLVTYKTTDPLFVIDLKDPKKPTLLGELKISGYSSYLHPYDENHIIGIGRETEEVINRDAFGRVISTWAVNKGLKMSLFDVTDVKNPKQISTVVIGDSSTYSNILENHKALLFSKAKNLIAIPVNGYDIEKARLYSDIDTLVNSEYFVKSGFAVYEITLEKGFVEKGTIMHEGINKEKRWYSRSMVPVRGLYIEDTLYTISNSKILANRIKDLALIKSVNLDNKGEVK